MKSKAIVAVVCCALFAFCLGADAMPKKQGKARLVVLRPDGTEEFEFTRDHLRSGYVRAFMHWALDDAQTPHDPDAVLCLGSSSMRGWSNIKKDLAPAKIIHRGFGGSRMGSVVRFADFFARYKVGRIVVYEGDNDMSL